MYWLIALVVFGVCCTCPLLWYLVETRYHNTYRIREEKRGNGKTKYYVEKYEPYRHIGAYHWEEKSIWSALEDAFQDMQKRQQEDYEVSVVKTKYYTAPPKKDIENEQLMKINAKLLEEIEGLKEALK